MAKDTEFEVGKEALSYCGKCKESSIHTIKTISKKGMPDKCECKVCKAKHKYRDPDKPVKPRATTRKATLSAEAIWTEAMSNAKGTTKPYKMSGDFSEGQLVDHSKFGIGVVTETVGQSKIKVVFEADEKLLIHNHS